MPSSGGHGLVALCPPYVLFTQNIWVWNAVDDLPIIYTFDIVHLQALQNKALIAAINQDGVVFIANSP